MRLGFLQSLEHDQVIKTVDELGLEEFLRRFHHLVFNAAVVGNVLLHRGKTEAGLAFDGFSTNV